ncbi:UNVERIFIED_CONTAM: PRA1 family protein B3 [Sesamum radiatum]|uniref:PRA1 family protein B3 n=1 Tax=Sesamum radiatum TaxID=300843 RepID=A0AAW2JXU6_SESRA
MSTSISGNSNGAFVSDTKQDVLSEKKSSLGATLPNGFEALLSEVCDETEIAELKFKIGTFKFHMKRKIDGPTILATAVPQITAPPVPSKPANESTSAVPPPQSKTEKVSPFTNVSVEKAAKLAALEASGSGSYVIVSSPTVGSFRRARTLKGKKQPPACKEGDMIKEGQTVGFWISLAHSTSCQKAVGYGDPLIAVLPSFHDINHGSPGDAPDLQSQSESQPPIATPAFRAFLSRLNATVRHGFSQRRPWLELLDRSSFSRPDSLSEAASRIRKNFSYFRINYISLLALSLAFSLLSHPFSLIVLLSLLAAWLFLYSFRPSDQPVVVAGRTFSDREVLGILVVSTIVVVFLTSVGSLLISALLVGLAVVCTHGAFRMPEDLFLDEQEPLNSGFLSFLGGAASAAAAAAPAVATRV